MKRRPQWDDSLADRNQYRLTYAEQLQRKASLVSKNKEQAREELIKRQEQLKLGKIPEDVKKTITNPPKKVAQKPMKTLKKSSSAVGEIYPPSEPINPPNHFAVLKKTFKSIAEDQHESLNKLDIAMKELEASMLKAVNSKPEEIPLEHNYKHEGYRDDTISEASLFGISDDDELGVSKFSDFSKVSGIRKHENTHKIEENELKYEQKCDDEFQEYLKGKKNDNEVTAKFNFNEDIKLEDDRIPFENV